MPRLTPQAGNEQRGPLDDLYRLVKELKYRIEVLENRPAIDTATIHNALAEHPDMGEFRAFMDKWRNR